MKRSRRVFRTSLLIPEKRAAWEAEQLRIEEVRQKKEWGHLSPEEQKTRIEFRESMLVTIRELCQDLYGNNTDKKEGS